MGWTLRFCRTALRLWFTACAHSTLASPSGLLMLELVRFAVDRDVSVLWKTSNKLTHIRNLPGNATVFNLKERIQDEEGLQPRTIRLIHRKAFPEGSHMLTVHSSGGRMLEDPVLFFEYNIPADEDVWALPRVRSDDPVKPAVGFLVVHVFPSSSSAAAATPTAASAESKSEGERTSKDAGGKAEAKEVTEGKAPILRTSSIWVTGASAVSPFA